MTTTEIIVALVVTFLIPVIILISKFAVSNLKIKEIDEDVKQLMKDRDACKLESQKKMNSTLAYEKFVHLPVYIEGMKNLEEKMLKEMEHLNKTLTHQSLTMDKIFAFMKKD